MRNANEWYWNSLILGRYCSLNNTTQVGESLQLSAVNYTDITYSNMASFNYSHLNLTLIKMQYLIPIIMQSIEGNISSHGSFPRQWLQYTCLNFRITASYREQRQYMLNSPQLRWDLPIMKLGRLQNITKVCIFIAQHWK